MRLDKLRSYEIMDTQEEAEFDNLARLAAEICDVPYGKINFLDDQRSWSKANYGNEIKETSREIAFCHYTIQHETHMIVEDTLEDERFKESPFVVESPNVRFYAGFNIKASGYNLGTICVLGQKPKKLSESQINALSTIASEIQSRLELKKKNKDLATISAFLEASVEAMLIVNPDNSEIERLNSNGSDLLERLIPGNKKQHLYDLYPDWEYLEFLKSWHEEGVEEPFTMETSLIDNNGQRAYLQVNTTRKYGKWLITFSNITKRRLAEERLKSEKKLSDAIINALPSHFYMFDEEMNFIRWNKNIIETTGHTGDELAKLKPTDFFEGEDVPRIRDYVAKTMGGFVGSIQADLVLKDGSKEPYIFHAVTFENNDKKYLLGSGQSVAEQVEYQSNLENLVQEKEVLLQEVHHRVKNNLAVISGFLQLQELISEHEESKKVLLSNYMRVKSMALIHEQLYKANDFTGLYFEKFLVRMLEEVEHRFSDAKKDIELKIISDPIYMNLNQAVPLSLIINELVSNAYNFAFENRDSGTIRVQLQNLGEQIILSVEDDGIGLPDDFKFEESPTLGTTLVMSYSDQLNGDVQIESKIGTKYILSFRKKEFDSGSALNIAV